MIALIDGDEAPAVGAKPFVVVLWMVGESLDLPWHFGVGLELPGCRRRATWGILLFSLAPCSRLSPAGSTIPWTRDGVDIGGLHAIVPPEFRRWTRLQ